MIQQIVNAVIPVAVAALVGVLAAIIKSVGNAAVALITKKREEIEAHIGKASYEQRLAFARQAWSITDEYFRITPSVTKTVEAAQTKFDEVLKGIVPSLTDDEIAQLRQAVAGEVNKGRDAITAK